MARLRHLDERKAMVAASLEMNRLGINQGTSGNLGVRVAGRFLVTPTGVPASALAPELMVEMDFDGRFKGDVMPSSEWRFHRDILAARPDANAVVHCHAMFTTTLAILRKEIPPVHYMIAAAGGDTIRCAPYATYGTQQLSDHALEGARGSQGVPARQPRHDRDRPDARARAVPWRWKSRRWRPSTGARSRPASRFCCRKRRSRRCSRSSAATASSRGSRQRLQTRRAGAGRRLERSWADGSAAPVRGQASQPFAFARREAPKSAAKPEPRSSSVPGAGTSVPGGGGGGGGGTSGSIVARAAVCRSSTGV
jgi:hypothetical protein